MITKEDILELFNTIRCDLLQYPMHRKKVEQICKKIKKEKYNILNHLLSINIGKILYYNLIEYIVIKRNNYLPIIEKYFNITVKNPIRMIKIYTNYSFGSFRLIEYVIRKSNIQYEDLLQFKFNKKKLNSYKKEINDKNKKKLYKLYLLKFINYPRFDINLLSVINKFILLKVGKCLY